MLSRWIIVVIASVWSTNFIVSAIALTLELPPTADSSIIGISFDNVTDVEIVEASPIQSLLLGSQNLNVNQSSSLSASDDLEYGCVPAYGTPLPVACRSVFRQMPNSERTVTFSDLRNTGNTDISLPFRMSSGRPYEILSSNY